MIVANGNFHLAEFCCGAAALTCSLIPNGELLVPFQGNKWKMRYPLHSVLASRGYSNLTSAHINDAGPWGLVWQGLLFHRKSVLEYLREMNSVDPREVFDQLNKHLVPDFSDYAQFAAQFLFLQRVSYSGKAVGIKNNCWTSPGFNKTHAYGECRATFGEVKPMVPCLIRRIENMSNWGLPSISVTYGDAKDLVLNFQGPTVCYLDPPYLEGTKFPGVDLIRAEVVEVAISQHLAGHFVMVSEATPVEELMELGWEAVELKKISTIQSPFRSKKSEWVTLSPRILE